MSFEARFGQAAGLYSAFRPEYPGEIFQRLLAHVPVERRECAMDLGAGTGKATVVLAKHFARVIAVEPDPLMAEKLRETAPQAEVRATTAEECEQEAASIDLVNFATALHWMDVPRVMENAARWLRPGGILAVYSGDFPKGPAAVRDVIRHEFREHWDQFRDERLKDKEFPRNIVRATAGFHTAEDTTVSSTLDMTAHDFAGYCSSTSYGSAYGRSLGDAAAEAYWRNLESRFREAAKADKIPIAFDLYLLILRRE
jgi:trans-aconitate methyltransferase